LIDKVELGNRIWEIDNLEEEGSYHDALSQAMSLVEWAGSQGDPALLAEATLWRGYLMENVGRYVEAERDLREAYKLAIGNKLGKIGVAAAVRLGVLIGVQQANYYEAERWETVAAAMADDCDDARGGAYAYVGLGILLAEQGKYEDAEAKVRQGLRQLEEALGSDSAEIADVLRRLSDIVSRRGNAESAEVLAHQALRVSENALGPGHADVAQSMGNLGYIIASHGKDSEGEEWIRKGIRVMEGSLRSEHPTMSDLLHGLGVVLAHQGRHKEAEAQFQRTLQIRENSLGATHPRVADVLSDFGDLLMDQGRQIEAAEQYQRALRIREAIFGADHPHVADLNACLAEAVLAQGDAGAARQYGERAVSVLESIAAGPPRLARARFVLARSLWVDSAQRSRARMLAEQALDGYSEQVYLEKKERAEVDRWLNGHRAGR
jgi:tetratricopeptide (TPR) repeat protein